MTAGSLARWPAPKLRVQLLPGWAATALIAAASAAAITAAGSVTQPELVAASRALIAGVPIAVGLYAWEHGTSERFGLLLAAVGAGCLVATLAESSDGGLYTIGRSAGWLVEVLLVYVVLAYPSGHLTGKADRVLVAVMALTAALLFAPRLTLAEDFSIPSPYTSCVADCPANAAFMLEREPGFVDMILRPVGVLLVLVVGVGLLWRLRERLRASTPLARQMFTLVLAVGVARELAIGALFTTRFGDSTAWPYQAASWLIAFAVPAFALAFAFGLVRWRLFAGVALERLAVCLRAAPNANGLREGLADAFGDPDLEIAFPADGAADRWVSASGEAMAPPAATRGRSVSEVRQRGTVVAAVAHDSALDATPALLDAGLAMAAVALDNQRLTAEARAATLEVERSRNRIAAAADRERRRIERDLHDGAQQRLVALRIELELAEQLVREDAELGARRLHELEGEVDETLDELRSLAHGVYPPLLADRGLADALREAAARCPVPARIDVLVAGRYSSEVESAVYFCVLEALQNVAKHATGARHVTVRLDGRHEGRLRFSIRDDGAGIPHADPARSGSGLTNMHDRLAAVGGQLDVASRPGLGTTVRGDVRLYDDRRSA